MEISYQDINRKTIDRWVDDGWEWGKPISREVYAAAKNGQWDGRGRGLPRRLPGGAAEPPAGITKNRTIPEDLVFGDRFMRTSC